MRVSPVTTLAAEHVLPFFRGRATHIHTEENVHAWPFGVQTSLRLDQSSGERISSKVSVPTCKVLPTSASVTATTSSTNRIVCRFNTYLHVTLSPTFHHFVCSKLCAGYTPGMRRTISNETPLLSADLRFLTSEMPLGARASPRIEVQRFGPPAAMQRSGIVVRRSALLCVVFFCNNPYLKPRALDSSVKTARDLEYTPTAQPCDKTVLRRPLVNVWLGFDHGKSGLGKEVTDAHWAPAI